MIPHIITSKATEGCRAQLWVFVYRLKYFVLAAWKWEHGCCCVVFFVFFLQLEVLFFCREPCFLMSSAKTSCSRWLCRSGLVFNAILHSQTNYHSRFLFAATEHRAFCFVRFPSVFKRVLTQWCNLVQFHLFEGPAEALVSETFERGAFSPPLASLSFVWELLTSDAAQFGRICLNPAFLYVCRMHLQNTVWHKLQQKQRQANKNKQTNKKNLSYFLFFFVIKARLFLDRLSFICLCNWNLKITDREYPWWFPLSWFGAGYSSLNSVQYIVLMCRWLFVVSPVFIICIFNNNLNMFFCLFSLFFVVQSYLV